MKTTEEILSGYLSECFFDWYQVTFTEKMLPEWVVSSALQNWDFLSVENSKPRVKQYHHAVDIKRGDRVYIHLCWGGVNEGLHLLSTGSISHEVATWLQSNYSGKYGVSRVDVRHDTNVSGMWHYLYQRCRDVSDECRVSRRQVGDWDVEGSPSGRTYYLGSQSSSVQLRLYEKGKKERGNPDWVRLELQVRPSKLHQKIKASHWRPSDFWRSSNWSSYLHGAVMYRSRRIGSESMGTVWSASSHEKAVIAMLNQYGKTLERLAESIPGGWSSLGEYLQVMRDIMNENRKALSGLGESPYEDALSRLLGVSSRK